MTKAECQMQNHHQLTTGGKIWMEIELNFRLKLFQNLGVLGNIIVYL